VVVHLEIGPTDYVDTLWCSDGSMPVWNVIFKVNNGLLDNWIDNIGFQVCEVDHVEVWGAWLEEVDEGKSGDASLEVGFSVAVEIRLSNLEMFRDVSNILIPFFDFT